VPEKTYDEILKLQFAQIMDIAMSANVEPVEGPEWLQHAEDIAEKLILCPTHDEAEKLLLANMVKLQSFIVAASFLLKCCQKVPIDRRTSGKNTPFYEICELMIQTFRDTRQS
jgi:hypothetical protein